MQFKKSNYIGQRSSLELALGRCEQMRQTGLWMVSGKYKTISEIRCHRCEEECTQVRTPVMLQSSCLCLKSIFTMIHQVDLRLVGHTQGQEGRESCAASS